MFDYYFFQKVLYIFKSNRLECVNYVKLPLNALVPPARNRDEGAAFFLHRLLFLPVFPIQREETDRMVKNKNVSREMEEIVSERKGAYESKRVREEGRKRGR